MSQSAPSDCTLCHIPCCRIHNVHVTAEMLCEHRVTHRFRASDRSAWKCRFREVEIYLSSACQPLPAQPLPTEERRPWVFFAHFWRGSHWGGEDIWTQVFTCSLITGNRLRSHKAGETRKQKIRKKHIALWYISIIIITVTGLARGKNDWPAKEHSSW